MKFRQRSVEGALLFAMLLAAGSRIAPPAQAESSEATKYIYYEGIVASVNHQSGDLVVMGNREDMPDDDIIVKLKADPKTVDVTDSAQHALEFVHVAREDQIGAECRLEGQTLVVESVYIYAIKDPDAENFVEVKRYNQNIEL